MTPRDYEDVLENMLAAMGYTVYRPPNSGAANGGGHGDIVVKLNSGFARLDVKAWKKKPPPTDKWGNICVWARRVEKKVEFVVDENLFSAPPHTEEMTFVFDGVEIITVVAPRLENLVREVLHEKVYRERVLPLAYPGF